MVSVAAVNDAPSFTGPSEIWAVEGMPYSLINTDYYEMLGATMWLRQGANSSHVDKTPHPLRKQFEKTCSQGVCEKVWTGSTVDATTGRTLSIRRENGIGILDPDSKDYGYDTWKVQVTLRASHGRLFVNERFLEEVLFNGDLECDLETDPSVSESGCRIRLVDTGHEQGKVGLYSQKTSSFAEDSSCAALVEYTTVSIPQADGTLKSNEQRKILGTRKVPSKIVSTTSKAWGCPCYSNVIFDDTGHSYDAQQPGNNRFKHCSKSLLFNNRMPLERGQNVPLVGNRFIAFQGSLRDISQVLANITYLPDPQFNTRIPGRSSLDDLWYLD